MPSERTARLEAMYEALAQRVDGHARTLYGANGNGGLQADVAHIALSHNAHVKATDAALKQTGDVLLGENRDGSEGVLHDVDGLMRSQETRSKWFWIFAGAAVAEAVSLGFLYVRHGA